MRQFVTVLTPFEYELAWTIRCLSEAGEQRGRSMHNCPSLRNIFTATKKRIAKMRLDPSKIPPHMFVDAAQRLLECGLIEAKKFAGDTYRIRWVSEWDENDDFEESLVPLQIGVARGSFHEWFDDMLGLNGGANRSRYAPQDQFERNGNARLIPKTR